MIERESTLQPLSVKSCILKKICTHTKRTNSARCYIIMTLREKSKTDVSISVEADAERVISVHSTGWGVVVRESDSGLQGQLQSLTGEPLACNIIR